MPMQDIPDWILQAKILNNLDSDKFYPYYSLKILPVPNSLATLIIAGTGRFIGEEKGAEITTALCILLFAFGFVYLRRADGRLAPALEIIGVLFAVNHFLMMGYLNFALGLGLSFFAIGYYWRRAPFFAKESAIVLSVFLLLIYFSHFLPFLISSIAIMLIAWRTYYKDLKKYILPALSLAPTIPLLVWYTFARAGNFEVSYQYSIVNYLFYKLSPFAPVSNYYPITPTNIAWASVIANGFVILGSIVLVGWLIATKRARFWSPLILTSVFLAVLGLAAPTKIFELVRPGQRLLFASFFIFLAGIEGPRSLRKEIKLLTAFVFATIITVNGANMFFAGRHVDYLDDVIKREVVNPTNLLLLNDSHFENSKNESFLDKVRSPFSYPVWVNPLKLTAYYYVVDKGGLIGYLFPSGFISVRKERPPAMNSLSQLRDKDRIKEYSHIILTGPWKNHFAIQKAVSHSFKTSYFDIYFRILTRVPDDK